MPGTLITEELEVKDTGGGRGPERGGRDDGGGGDSPEGHPGGPGTPRSAYLTGISLGLGAILMFFMALTSAYIVRKGASGDWQPIELPSILWATTSLLIVSSLTLEQARRHLGRNDLAGFRQWWGLTTALGILFLLGQLWAWRQLADAGIYLPTNPSSSFFYLLTGTHGVHLLGGILALLYVAFRAADLGRMLKGAAAEVTAIYWHFMDGLWVFLFLLLRLGR